MSGRANGRAPAIACALLLSWGCSSSTSSTTDDDSAQSSGELQLIVAYGASCQDYWPGACLTDNRGSALLCDGYNWWPDHDLHCRSDNWNNSSDCPEQCPADSGGWILGCGGDLHFFCPGGCVGDDYGAYCLAPPQGCRRWCGFNDQGRPAVLSSCFDDDSECPPAYCTDDHQGHARCTWGDYSGGI